ncbi:MAG TPA: xanthine dehydrogenase family protein, partial [Methylomirabilota bacterium]|nr:xanthine dehydrogenase family protein [Methylomirabilota bacterium]
MARVGAAHLGVVRSPHAHARITSINLAAARKRPGVLAAWSAADLSDVARGIPAAFGGSHKGRPFAVPILATDRVRYVGEAVAVVVAGDVHTLADALEAVRVDYVPLPALSSVEAAAASKTRVHEPWPDNTTLPVGAKVGDPEAAFAGADVVVGGRFRHGRLAAVPIETRGAIAWRDPDSDALVLWASIQNPYRLRDAIATALGRPAETVRVHVPDVGGGFGPKGDVYPDEILVAAAALKLNRPVKWIESRREDFMALGHDREQVHEARIGLARDGRIVALETT